MESFVIGSLSVLLVVTAGLLVLVVRVLVAGSLVDRSAPVAPPVDVTGLVDAVGRAVSDAVRVSQGPVPVEVVEPDDAVGRAPWDVDPVSALTHFIDPTDESWPDPGRDSTLVIPPGLDLAFALGIEQPRDRTVGDV